MRCEALHPHGRDSGHGAWLRPAESGDAQAALRAAQCPSSVHHDAAARRGHDARPVDLSHGHLEPARSIKDMADGRPAGTGSVSESPSRKPLKADSQGAGVTQR